MNKYISPEVVETKNSDLTREKVLAVAQDFKSSWRDLAEVLNSVNNTQAFKAWGFESFEDYTTKEIKIRKNTALKLIQSYRFLRTEEPRYFKPVEDGEPKEELPPLEAVETLRKAKTNLDEPQYKKIKNYILKEERDLPEVKKDLTAMIKERRRNNDGEAERVKKDTAAVKRFVGVLSAFKKEAQLTHILPGTIIEDIDGLIAAINANLARETDSEKLLK